MRWQIMTVVGLCFLTACDGIMNTPTCDGHDAATRVEPPDAGASTLDAGEQPDAGEVERDAGAMAPVDAGAPIDAGTPLPDCTAYVSASGMVAGHAAATTLQAGIDALTPGSTLCVAPGSYHELISVVTSGTAAAPITIRALDVAQHPVVDGEYTLPGGAPGNDDPCSEVAQDPNANLGPYPAQACFSWANLVQIAASHVSWISIDVTRSRGRGVTLGDELQAGPFVDLKFQDSDVGHLRNNGVYFFHVQQGVFSGNTLHDADDFEATFMRGSLNWAGGLYEDDCDGIEIVGNTIFHIWGEAVGLGLFHLTQNVHFARNVVYDSFALELYVQNVDTALIEQNVFYNSGDPAYFRGGEPSPCVVFDSETGGRTAHITFRNNLVTGCDELIGFWQFTAASTYEDFEILDNTLTSPAGSGIVFNSDMTTLTGFIFQNNLIYAPGGTVGTPNPIPDLQVGHNLWTVDPPAVLAGAGDIVTAAPGLSNPGYAPAAGAFDVSAFALTATSAALGQATPSVAVTDDFFGNPRGPAPDIGAIQR
jgi:hypothetical protein